MEGTRMYTAIISWSSIDVVKKFVNLANNYDFPINLHSEKYIVNGKSIMGIFSLDLSKPIELEVEGDCPQQFIDELKPFLISA